MLNCLRVRLCFPFAFSNIDGIAAIDEEVYGDGDCFRCGEKIGAVTNALAMAENSATLLLVGPKKSDLIPIPLSASTTAKPAPARSRL